MVLVARAYPGIRSGGFSPFWRSVLPGSFGDKRMVKLERVQGEVAVK
jgi:hypothetical protein